MTVHLLGSLNGEPFAFTPTFGLYSDNTPWVKGYPDDFAKIDQAIIRWDSLQDFIAALWYLDSFSAEFHPVETLYVPFFPCARQDRVNENGDVLNSKFNIVKMLDRFYELNVFKELVTFDDHSLMGHSLARFPWINLTPASLIVAQTRLGVSVNPTEGYYDTIIAPDKGARARAEEIGALYHTPVVVADKIRDTSDGRITHYEIDTSQTALQKVLVVDDICDGGATFEILADSLPFNTEKHLFVTHGLFSRGTDRLLDRYDHIITTNSVYREKGRSRLQVIDLFPGVEL